MNKKIYKDPFIILLLAVWLIGGFFSQRVYGSAASSFQQLSIVAFLSLIIYIVARPFLSKRKIKPGVVIAISVGLGFLILLVVGMIALSAMNSG